MTPVPSTCPPLYCTDPDAIRAAIDVADERARLLRRLLRLALRFRLHLVTADCLLSSAADRQEVRRG